MITHDRCGATQFNVSTVDVSNPMAIRWTRSVEGYMQRRIHRPWRKRGS